MNRFLNRLFRRRPVAGAPSENLAGPDGRQQYVAEARRPRGPLQGLLESIPDPVLVIDRERRILLANKAARQVGGVAEVIGIIRDVTARDQAQEALRRSCA